MSTTARIAAVGAIQWRMWSMVGGAELNLAGNKAWRLFAVYRVKYCPP
jgi:hypothetical protein